MDSNEPISQISLSYLKILNSTLLELFPKAQLLFDQQQGPYFTTQLKISSQIKEVDLDLIENQFIHRLNQNLEVEFFEMASAAAAELFKCKNQNCLLEEVLNESESLFQIVKVEGSYDINRQTEQKEFIFGKCDLLKAVVRLGKFNNELTIWGASALNQQDLKQEVKRYKQLQKFSLTNLNKQMHLYKDAFLLPAGAALFDAIKSKIETTFLDSGFDKLFPITTQANILFELRKHASKEASNPFFIWLNQPHASKDIFTNSLYQIQNKTLDYWFFPTNERSIAKDCISCLNFYRQMIKILGFSYRVKFFCSQASYLHPLLKKNLDDIDENVTFKESSACKIEFELIDRYERVLLKPVIVISESKGKHECLISGTFCESVETLLGQLVEHHRTELLKHSLWTVGDLR